MPDGSSLLRRALQQPVLHFFALGALLFAAHHAVQGDPNAIVVTPGVKADLARRFQDDQGRPPTEAEAAAALRTWKLEEALFREALRRGLERNDRGVRSLLIESLRAQALLEAPKRQPSEAELTRWLDTHRSLYEKPQRYLLEWLAVDKTKPAAHAVLGELEAKLKAGAEPNGLKLPVFGANLDSATARERLGDPLVHFLLKLARGIVLNFLPDARLGDGSEMIGLVRDRLGPLRYGRESRVAAERSDARAAHEEGSLLRGAAGCLLDPGGDTGRDVLGQFREGDRPVAVSVGGSL